MILARLMVLVLVVGVGAISVEDVRQMSAESRKTVETKIATFVENEIELVAKSSASTETAFNMNRKPFDEHPNPVQFLRNHLVGFEIADNKNHCIDTNKYGGFPKLECAHIVKVSW